MRNPNPTCELECRFIHSPTLTTCMGFTPIYDKHGNNLNPDRNITTGTIWCSVCNTQWGFKQCLNEIEYSVLQKPVVE